MFSPSSVSTYFSQFFNGFMRRNTDNNIDANSDHIVSNNIPQITYEIAPREQIIGRALRYNPTLDLVSYLIRTPTLTQTQLDNYLLDVDLECEECNIIECTICLSNWTRICEKDICENIYDEINWTEELIAHIGMFDYECTNTYFDTDNKIHYVVSVLTQDRIQIAKGEGNTITHAKNIAAKNAIINFTSNSYAKNIVREHMENKLSVENDKKWCKLSCGHYFHIECVGTWLSRTLECPNCRAKPKIFALEFKSKFEEKKSEGLDESKEQEEQIEPVQDTNLSLREQNIIVEIYSRIDGFNSEQRKFFLHLIRTREYDVISEQCQNLKLSYRLLDIFINSTIIDKNNVSNPSALGSSYQYENPNLLNSTRLKAYMNYSMAKLRTQYGKMFRSYSKSYFDVFYRNRHQKRTFLVGMDNVNTTTAQANFLSWFITNPIALPTLIYAHKHNLIKCTKLNTREKLYLEQERQNWANYRG